DEGGLARAGGSANDDPLALSDRQVDVLQNLEGAVPFVDGDQLHGCAGVAAPGRSGAFASTDIAQRIVSHVQVCRPMRIEAMRSRPFPERAFFPGLASSRAEAAAWLAIGPGSNESKRQASCRGRIGGISRFDSIRCFRTAYVKEYVLDCQ